MLAAEFHAALVADCLAHVFLAEARGYTRQACAHADLVQVFQNVGIARFALVEGLGITQKNLAVAEHNPGNLYGRACLCVVGG